MLLLKKRSNISSSLSTTNSALAKRFGLGLALAKRIIGLRKRSHQRAERCRCGTYIAFTELIRLSHISVNSHAVLVQSMFKAFGSRSWRLIKWYELPIAFSVVLLVVLSTLFDTWALSQTKNIELALKNKRLMLQNDSILNICQY